MKKDILIIANFTSGLESDTKGRFAYLASILVQKADVEIITSTFIHEKKSHIINPDRDYSFKCTFVAEPGYPKNICLKRFYSHKIFGINVKKYLASRKKPDLIYCAIPSLTVAGYVADYCINNHIKFVIDIQDLWPEAFRMIVDPPIINRLLYLPFERLANKAYRNADMIVAVSQTYVDRAKKVNNKAEICKTVYLGTEVERFKEYAIIDYPIYKEPDALWLGYCGTLGSSYDLDTVCQALYLLKTAGKEYPVFVIMGDGPKESEFKQTAKRLGVNCIFTGRLPYSEMCAVLSKCDMVVNPIMPKAAQSIINKHADYAASGLPVLNTQDSKEYRRLVEQYQMGLNCDNHSPEDLAEKISILYQSRELRQQMGDNAAKCAVEKFDRKNVYNELAELLVE